MTTKLIFTSALSFLGTSILSAQASASLHAAREEELAIINTVRLLEQNALSVLIGAVVLMGFVWLCYVLKSCTRLNKPQGTTRGSFTALLVLVVGLGVFCGGCSVGQRAMTGVERAAKPAELGACRWSHHDENNLNRPFVANRYPANGYSDWHVPSFCKYCGQRVFNSRH